MPLSGILAESSWKLIFYVIAGMLFVNSVLWYWLAANSPREYRLISKEEKEYIENGLNVLDQVSKIIIQHKSVFLFLKDNFHNKG
jgi:hypothetical protein